MGFNVSFLEVNKIVKLLLELYAFDDEAETILKKDQLLAFHASKQIVVLDLLCKCLCKEIFGENLSLLQKSRPWGGCETALLRSIKMLQLFKK